MIKTIQLLKESFLTYKTNFKNIFNMTWPIVLFTIAALYYSVNITQMFETNQLDLTYFILAFVIYLLSLLIVGLFLTPALNRSLQKNEDKGVFDIKEGYSFQKKNIWKFIKVNLWGMVYMLKRMAPYIIISLLLVGVSLAFTDSGTAILVTASLIALIMIIGILLNITRFTVYQNVFFSKDDISAKDAVKESMSLGVIKMGAIWKIILAAILVSIVIEIIIYILSIFIDITLFDLVVEAVVRGMFSMPLIMIIVAKAYVKIKVEDVKLPMEEVVEVV